MAVEEIVTDFAPVAENTAAPPAVAEPPTTGFVPVAEAPADRTGFDLLPRPQPTISQAPPEPAASWLGHFWEQTKQITPKESARASWAVVTAEQLHITPSEALDNEDAIRAQLGDATRHPIRQGGETLMGATAAATVVPLAITAPWVAVGGLALFQAAVQADSYAVSLKTGKPWDFFDPQHLADLLPEDASALTINAVDTLELIGQVLAVSAGFKYAPKLKARLTRQVIDTYNLPKNVYIDGAELKTELQRGGALDTEIMDIYRQAGVTGEQVRAATRPGAGLVLTIPAEQITTWQDRPWYAGVKKLLRLRPSDTKVTAVQPPTQARAVAGLLPAPGESTAGKQATGGPEPAPAAPEAAPVPPTAEEAMTALQAAPVATDAQIGAIFDTAVGVTVPAAEVAVVPPPITAINESTGLPLNSDGTVTLYHHTTAKQAEQIRLTGILKSSGEPDVYVTTESTPTTGYGDTVVPVRVNPDKLILNDEFPSGRKDFSIDVGKPGGSIQIGVEISKAPQSAVEPVLTTITQVQAQEQHARLVEEAVKFVTDHSPNLVPEMIDRAVAAGYDRTSVTAYADAYRETKALAQAPDVALARSGTIRPAEPITAKSIIRAATGQVKEVAAPISELGQLKHAYLMSARASRIAYRAGNTEGVAAENARMQDILARAKASKQARAVVAGRIAQAKEIKTSAVGKIALDYQKKITALFEGVDLTKPTDATIERLQGLSEFIQREGVPLEISQAEVNQIDRLSKIPFRDLSSEAQQALLDAAQNLYDFGALKRGLQQTKAGRELAAERDALVASTHNLDPSLSGESPPTKMDYLKQGPGVVDREFLHNFRVTNMIDGTLDYEGKNTAMIQEQMHAELAANHASLQIINRLAVQLKALNLPDLPATIRRIYPVLMAEQGARSQAAALLAKDGLTELPTLTTMERQVVTILREAAGSMTKEITEVYEHRNNEPFLTVHNYIPIAYEGDAYVPVEDAIDQNRYRTRQVTQGFTERRVPGVTEVPREDLLAVIENGIQNHAWYVQVQPVLDRHAALLRTPEYKAAAGELASDWWKDQIDILARKGWKAGAIPTTKAGTVIAHLLRAGRINIIHAVLPFKVSSGVLQVFATGDALAYSTSRWGPVDGLRMALATGKAWVKVKSTLVYIAQTPELAMRRGAGEPAVEEVLRPTKGVEGLKTKWAKIGITPLVFGDIMTAAGAEMGMIDILTAHGMSEAEAKTQAVFLMNLVSGSSYVSLRPHILATGELARSALTFQTFFLNRWGEIHDFVRTVKRGGWKRKVLALAGLGILLATDMGEDKARKTIYEWTTGKNSKQPNESLIKSVLLYVPRNLPLVGSYFRQLPLEPPVAREVKKAAEGIQQVTSAKPVAGFENLAEAVLSLLAGWPGTSQGFDLLDNAISDIKKEEADAAKRQ